MLDNDVNEKNIDSKENKNNNQTKKDKILTIVGIVICAILLPLLIMNITIVIKSKVSDDVPGFGKYVPFLIKTNSMEGDNEGCYNGGDIIICKLIDAEDVEIGDVIAFYDPDGNGTTVVTHRVIEIEIKDEKLYFKTKGDNNNGADRTLVPEENVIAKYTNFRIPLLGHVALFMAEPAGFIVCVLCPLGLLIGYDVIRRRMRDKANQEDTKALLAELEALRASRDSVQHDSEEIKEEAINDSSEDEK